MNIRKAGLLDIDDVIDMGRAMYHESIYSNYSEYLPFSEEACRKSFADRIMDRSSIVLLAIKDGVKVGMFAGYIAKPYFSDDTVSHDFLLYVRYPFRGTSAARRLVNAYIGWAKLKQVAMITVGVSAGIDNEKTIEFYEDMGFKPFGTSLIYGGD